MKSPKAIGLNFLRSAAVAAVASTCFVSAAQCFSWEDLNPFGASKYEMKVDPDVPVDRLYNEGLIKLDKKDYEGAAKRFVEVQKQYPFSQWARKSLMMEVYAYYENGSYTDTVTASDHYTTLYGNSPDAPYATYLAGMALFGELPDEHRDQDRVAKAIKYFQIIVDKYPNSPYAADARFKIQVARDQLAGHEMNVGRYYLKRQNYTAAINRFREVLFKYPNTREAEEALERLTEAYLAMGIVDEAETAAAVLGHNFPDSEWYKEAFERLKADGYAPQDHQESWISKAFKKVGMT
jgi:outer membrane protein assembly factor BamD